MIFIVDDDDAMRDSLRLVLEGEGMEVQDFASARQFLDAGPPLDADCLVLDIDMPGMSGLDLLTLLRRQGITLPVIIVSGRPTASNRKRALDAGAATLIEKSFCGEDIPQAIRQTLGRSRLTREAGHERSGW